jgi:hypothetical protein
MFESDDDPFYSTAALFGAQLVHGIDGDLYGFLVGDGAQHLACIVASSLHDTLALGFAQAKTDDVVRHLVEGLASASARRSTASSTSSSRMIRFCGPMAVPV